MASLIPGYNYDIFISYRQKDNKHDGWVSQFVKDLEGELDATFKENISIYFDENPHDRLQETHNVDKSLEDKLKCLIFIPILSRTYCDINCYAWQSEFLPFLKIAEKDSFSKDVKLRSGNVASRILPIKIHDLEKEDIELFERETGDVLRSMDFVFRTSSGVNRPLKANEDHPQDNLNKTYYRDQVNKAAIAIKEIIGGFKIENEQSRQPSDDEIIQQEEGSSEEHLSSNISAKSSKHKILTGTFTTLILILVLVFILFQRVFNKTSGSIKKDSDGKISIVVNNFENNTNDTTLNWLRIGIPELLRNYLAESSELSVQNSRTMEEVYESIGQARTASLLPSISKEVAVKLRAGSFISGSFQKYGNNILTLVKLIDTNSDELLWTGQAEGDINSIRFLADTLSEQLRNFLEIKALNHKTKQEFNDIFTTSSEAYRNYIEGMNSKLRKDYYSALSSFLQAYRIDTAYVLAKFYIATAYDALAVFEDQKYRKQAASWTQKAYEEKDKFSGDYRLWLEMWHAYYNTRNSAEVLKYCGLLEQSNIKSRHFWADIANTYMIFQKPDKAIKMFEKIEEINSEWEEDWKYQNFYGLFAWACQQTGLYEKEEEILIKGLRHFPDDPTLTWRLIICLILKGDSPGASELLNKRINTFRQAGWSDSQVERWLGNLYEQSNEFEKAEEKYYRALELDPDYDLCRFYLARYLIRQNKNIDESIELLNSLQEKYPDIFNYDLLLVKSDGLLKQGKFNTADSLLKILRDSCYTASLELDQLMKIANDSLSK